MSYTNKPFEELDCMDDFLMNAVAADPEVGEAFCRKVLSVLLRRKVEKIKVTAQSALPASTLNLRGIRIDVEIEEFSEEGQTQVSRVYDMEPHLRNDLNLPRHNRFYQAKSDSRYLGRGERDFSRLPDLFVITLLNFDPFGHDYMMYTIDNHCVEVEELQYEDGLQFIYFYTGGSKGGSTEIRTMLQYLQHSRPENAIDDATRELHSYVSRVKTSPEVRQDYMKFEDIIAYERRDAAKEAAVAAKLQDILELLEDYGEIPEALQKRLEETSDDVMLKKYHKLAAKVGSIEEFMHAMEKEQSALPLRP